MSSKLERNKLVYLAIAEGSTVNAVAQEYGISSTRALQIFAIVKRWLRAAGVLGVPDTVDELRRAIAKEQISVEMLRRVLSVTPP